MSSKVVAVLESESDPLKRANVVRDCKQQLASAAQEAAGTDGIRCDVKEMMPNES